MAERAARVCVVTGAASGIGRHMAVALRRQGHSVVAADIDGAGLESLAAEQAWQADERFLRHPIDVRRSAEWEQLIGLALARFGRLDVLLNIAGFLRPGNVHDIDLEIADRHIDVNVKGVMYGTRAAARAMMRQGSGHIVNVASIAGISAVPGLAAYCASKHAVRGFTLSVAHELSPHGIAVSVFCPDAVETPMLTLQERYPEAAMVFGGPRALSLAEVEAALLRVLRDRPLEVVLDVPFSARALGAKIANAFPRVLSIAAPLIVRGGRAAQMRRTRRDGAPH
jgi:3-oxoacyl-[acyl-carrier protein] reductase